MKILVEKYPVGSSSVEVSINPGETFESPRPTYLIVRHACLEVWEKYFPNNGHTYEQTRSKALTSLLRKAAAQRDALGTLLEEQGQ